MHHSITKKNIEKISKIVKDIQASGLQDGSRGKSGTHESPGT